MTGKQNIGRDCTPGFDSGADSYDLRL